MGLTVPGAETPSLQRVGLSFFFLTCIYLKHLKSMVTHRLSCFSYVFLLTNSTCWPLIHHFFTGQLNVLAYPFFLPANSTCWPFSVQPDGSHRLLLLAFPHAREILLEVLAIDRHRELDTIQLLKHVCISRQNLINLVRPMPSWRHLPYFLSLVPNGSTASQSRSPTWKFLA